MSELGPAALASTVLAPAFLASLLPVLSNTLASERYQTRVQAFLEAVNQELSEHGDALKSLTDPQFTILNEAVSAALQTTEEDKLAFLRNVVTNAVFEADVQAQQAAILSRWVRDMSADEVRFLIDAFDFDRRIRLLDDREESEQRVLDVLRNSPHGLCVIGLVSLGILSPSNDFWGGATKFIFHPLTVKLLALLKVRAPRSAEPDIETNEAAN